MKGGEGSVADHFNWVIFMIIDTEHAADLVTVSSVNQENCYPSYVVMWAIVTFSAGHELVMADDIMTMAWKV